MVGGVTPGKGGTTSKGSRSSTRCEQAVDATGANASVVFVPPAVAADAILEAADAGIPRGGRDHRGHPDARHGEGLALRVKDGKTRLIGPNCPGIISPGEKCKIGIMPGHIHRAGRSAS